MTLSKYVITQLKSAAPEVRLWNGSFNVASAIAEFDRHSFELNVTVTHPLLAEYACSEPHLVELVRRTGSRGNHIEVPEELLPLVQRLRQLGTMSDETAQNTLNSLRESLSASYRDMGLAPS